MVAPVVKPLGITAFSASVLVILESAFLGALPTLAYAATFAGPFVTLAGSSWSRRRVLSDADAQYVFEPLFLEVRKDREVVQSSETWSNIPFFDRNTLDQIRRSARYSLLKDRVPKVEAFCAAIEQVFTGQGDAKRAGNRIIGETIGPVLGENGISVAFRGRTKDGSANFEGVTWVTPMLIRGRDPREVLRRQKVEVEAVAVKDKNMSDTATLTFPKDEARYRRFWDAVEKKAKADPEIKELRDVLDTLPRLAEQAENQVLKEIKKS